MAPGTFVACALLFVLDLGVIGATVTQTASRPAGAIRPSPSQTASQPCPSARDLAAIDADFTVAFEGDPTGGTASGCGVATSGRDLTQLQAQVYRSLLLLRGLSFDQALPWTPETPYRWLKASIRGIRIRTDIPASFCCNPNNTIDLAIGRNSFLFVQGGTPDYNLVQFLALVVHEARHNNGFPHTCNGNDHKLSDMGAWSVQYYFLNWLALHAPAMFLERDQASLRSSADRLCSTRFCDGPCK